MRSEARFPTAILRVIRWSPRSSNPNRMTRAVASVHTPRLDSSVRTQYPISPTWFGCETCQIDTLPMWRSGSGHADGEVEGPVLVPRTRRVADELPGDRPRVSMRPWQVLDEGGVRGEHRSVDTAHVLPTIGAQRRSTAACTGPWSSEASSCETVSPTVAVTASPPLLTALILEQVLDMWTTLRRLAPVTPVSGDAEARSAVLIPLYEDDGRLRVILTKRPDTMRTHPGDVVFPGGRIEAGESPIDAAIREAWEEIALPADAVEVIGGLSPVTTRDVTNWIVPVVARITRPVVLVPDPSEVEHILEPTLGELLDESRWRTSVWMGSELWFYEFPEGTLWGATAFIVRQLLGVVRGGGTTPRHHR